MQRNDKKIKTNAKVVEQLDRIQTMSTLVARMNLTSQFGVQYGTDRDLYQALGYKLDLTYTNYVTQYTRHDIAKAVIDRPVKVTWSGPLSLIESADPSDKKLEDAWKRLEKDLRLKTNFIRLDKLTGLGHYGILLLGLDDIRTASDYKNPVRAGSRKLLYVRALGEGSASIKSWEKRTSSPRYGLPVLYDIQLSDPEGALISSGTTNTSNSSMQVHHSRIIHVVEGALESDVIGTPRLESIFNRLQDLEKIVGGSAEMFWRGARPGYTGKVDPEFTLGPVQEAALQSQLDEYEHNLRRFLVNEGIDITTLNTQVSSPLEHVDTQLMMISAETGIPKRILSGSERGELSSAQDSMEWTAYVQSRREEFAEPQIIRPFVNRMIDLGVLPKIGDAGYEIEWRDLFAISEKDKAEIGKIRATALKEYFTNPIAVEIIAPEAFLEQFLGLNREQIDSILEVTESELLRGLTIPVEQESTIPIEQASDE